MDESMMINEVIPNLELLLEAFQHNDRDAGNLFASSIATWKQFDPDGNLLGDKVHKKLDKLNKKYKKLCQPIKPKSKIGKIITRGGLTIATIIALGGCGNSSKEVTSPDSNANSINHNQDEFDKNYWNRAPLTGDSLVSQGTELKKLFGENGALGDAKFKDEDFAFLAFVSSMDELTNERAKSLLLSEVVAKKTSGQKILEKALKPVEDILDSGEFKFGENQSWAGIFAKKADSNMLDKLQKIYEKLCANPSVENKEELDKLLVEVLQNTPDYSEFAMQIAVMYVNHFRTFDQVSASDHALFVQSLDKECKNRNIPLYETDATVASNTNTSYSVSFTYTLAKIEDSLNLEDKVRKDDTIISDGDKSLKDVAAAIALVNVENKTRDGKTAAEIAMEQSEGYEEARGDARQNGRKMTSEDYKNIVTDSVTGQKSVNAGQASNNDKTGDVKDEVFIDQNGSKENNSNGQGKEDYKTWYDKGVADYKTGTKNSNPGNKTAYDAGWNFAKQEAEKVWDDQKDQTHIDTSEEIHYNDNANQNTPKDETKDTPKETTPSKPSTPEESKPSGGDEIVSEEIVLNDGYQYGSNGKLYDSEGHEVVLESESYTR